jgi:cobaltochelatase CobT
MYILSALFRKGPEKHRPIPYSVFTTKFDKLVGPDTLFDHLEVPKEIDELLSQQMWADYSEQLKSIWPNFNEDLKEIVARRCADMADGISSGIEATILIDHSGSGRAAEVRNTIACATECFMKALAAFGIKAEILGFTTVGWHGGQSRKLWQRRFRIKKPGRLCDLLHIVWHQPEWPEAKFSEDTVKSFFHSELLRENVDGEALLWAMQRLKDRPASRRILVVVSDGAPVDDSTLLHNHPSILVDHVEAVLRAAKSEGTIEIVGFGIGYEVNRYYETSRMACNMIEAASASLQLIDDVFAPLSGDGVAQIK